MSRAPWVLTSSPSTTDGSRSTATTLSIPQPFRGGLEPIRKAVEAKGMRLGLWIPLATIDKETADFRNHPEWVALDPEGNPKETDTAAGSKVVMCLASPFQNSAAARINDAIERFHLAYVKLDLTTVFNAYGEAPGCWPKDHNYAGWVESLGRIYEGIRNVTAEVYAKHPDVLLDLTFELWGQKHLIDAGLLAAGDLDWLSNVDDSERESAGPRQARALLYARATSMPAEAMLIGNMQAEVPDPAEIFATENRCGSRDAWRPAQADRMAAHLVSRPHPLVQAVALPSRSRRKLLRAR